MLPPRSTWGQTGDFWRGQVFDPSIDRSKVAIASLDIQGGISARDKGFKIDVATGALVEEIVKKP